MKTAKPFPFLVISFVAALGACNLFTPPFPFNNPHDPQNAWGYKGIVGKMYLSDGSGLSAISDFAVTPDGGSLVAATGNQNGIWEIPAVSGAPTRYGADSGATFGSLCLDATAATIYGLAGNSVWSVDRGTHAFTLIHSPTSGSTDTMFDIAIDAAGTLFIADNISGRCVIQKFDTSGSSLGTIDSPYLVNVSSIAVSDSCLYVSCLNYNCVLLLNKTTGATAGEIYWDGAIWHNISLSGGAPANGTSSPQQIAWNAAQARLYASFWEGHPIAVFDPSNFATPFQAFHGNGNDYADQGGTRIAVDNAGKMYASVPQSATITELSGGTTIYSPRAREPGEFLNLWDMHLGAGGTLYLVDNSLWQITSLTPDGQFHLFGTPGNGAGELAWPQAITEKNGEVYCGCIGGGWKVTHFSSSGAFIDESSVSAEGSPMRMATMADGRILIWANRPGFANAFYTYTTSPWTLAGGPFVPDPRFANATDVHLCLFGDGRMYCTLWNDTEASVGYLSDDLLTYTEIWSSASEPAFAAPAVGPARYKTTGISEAPAGDIWVAFNGLSAVARITADGSVFASFSTFNEYSGQKWSPGGLVAFSLDANGNRQGPDQRLMCADATQNVFVSSTQMDLQLMKYSPDVSLP